MNCKFCKSDRVNVAKRVKSPHFNQLYTLFECNDCQCRFFDVNEYLEIDLPKIYEKLAEKSGNNYTEKFREDRYWANQVKKITSLIGRKPISVLDVGCRTGDFLMHWENSVAVEGVELSRNSAQIAGKRGLVVHNDFLENISFCKKYEVVTCYAIIEHLVNPLVSLDKLAMIVAPEGILVIMIPTYQSLKRWLIDTFTSIRWHMYSPPEHLNYYSTKFLDNYLYNKGFNLKCRYWTTGGMFNPFLKIPKINHLFARAMHYYDQTFLNKLPIFDHLYSTYRKMSDGKV